MDRLVFVTSAAAFAVLAFTACAATRTTGGGGAAATTASGAGASSSTGEGGFMGVGPGGTGGSDGGCVGIASKASPVPLDIFIMLDQSGSMLQPAGNNLSRWETVKSALKTFVTEPSTAGIGVGLQYFGLPNPYVKGCPLIPCAMDADCTNGCTVCGPGGVCHGPYDGDTDACDAIEYAWAEVPVATLPGAGPAIIASLAMHAPGTNTPTAPALEGAIDYAKAWSSAHPGHLTVVAFATDGLPSDCDIIQADVNAIAAAGVAGTPSIKTYVIGVGPALQELDDIAKAGGTTTAFHIDVSPAAEQAFIDAMNTIRSGALACTYQIPAPPKGTQLDFALVNVDYTPGNGGAKRTIPRVSNKAACPASGDGWYYDNDANPTQIVLCGASCDAVSMDPMGEIAIVLGCGTILK